MTNNFEKNVDSLRQTLENLKYQYNRALTLRVAEEAEFAREIDSPEIQDLDVVRRAIELLRLADDEKIILVEKSDVLEKFFTEQIEAFREGIEWKERSAVFEEYEFLGSKEKNITEITFKIDNMLLTHVDKLTELFNKDKKEYEAYKEELLELLRETLGKTPAMTFYFKNRMKLLEKSYGIIIKEELKEAAPIKETIEETPQEITVLTTTPKKFKKKTVKEYFGEAQFGGQSIKSFRLFVKCPGCNQKQTITEVHNKCWNCNDFLHLKPVDTKEDRENEHYRTE